MLTQKRVEVWITGHLYMILYITFQVGLSLVHAIVILEAMRLIKICTMTAFHCLLCFSATHSFNDIFITNLKSSQFIWLIRCLKCISFFQWNSVFSPRVKRQVFIFLLIIIALSWAAFWVKSKTYVTTSEHFLFNMITQEEESFPQEIQTDHFQCWPWKNYPTG